MKKRGRKPFGFYEGEDEIIKLIRLWRRARKRTKAQKKNGKPPQPTSYRQIAHELNDNGYLTQTGKHFHGQTVRNILEDQPDEEPQEKARGHKKTELDPHDYLERTEVKKCRDIIKDNAELKMLFVFMVGSGVRSCEVRRLKIKDLSLKGKRSQVSILGKGRGKGKWRTVTLPLPLRAKLRKYIKGRQGYLFAGRNSEQLTYKSIYYRIKKIGRKAGFEWLHPHALRHTFGVVL